MSLKNSVGLVAKKIPGVSTTTCMSCTALRSTAHGRRDQHVLPVNFVVMDAAKAFVDGGRTRYRGRAGLDACRQGQSGPRCAGVAILREFGRRADEEAGIRARPDTQGGRAGVGAASAAAVGLVPLDERSGSGRPDPAGSSACLNSLPSRGFASDRQPRDRSCPLLTLLTSSTYGLWC